MNQTISLQTLGQVVTLLLALTAIIVVARKHKAAGAYSLIALGAALAIWSLAGIAYAANIGAATGAGVAAFAAICAPLLALHTIAVRMNRRSWFNGWRWFALVVVPLLTQALLRSGDSDSGLLSAEFLQTAGPRVLDLTVTATMLCAALFVLEALVMRRRSLTSPLGLALITILVPVGIGIASPLLYVVNSFPAFPLGMSVATLGIALWLFREVPEAVGLVDRETAVRGMDDGWMLLDLNNTILDTNPIASRIVGRSANELFGTSLTELVGELQPREPMQAEAEEIELRQMRPGESTPRYLNIRISPVHDHRKRAVARVAIWRDVTARKLQDEARQRARDEMFVLINAISTAAGNTLSTEDFLLEAMYHIIYPFRSQVVAIFLTDDPNKDPAAANFRLAAQLGLPAGAIEEMSLVPASEPLFELAVQQHKPLQLDDATQDNRIPRVIRRIPSAGMLILPLVAQPGGERRLIGCVMMIRKESPAYSHEDVVRLTTISDHMAGLIDSDRRRKLAIAMNERERLMRDLHDSVSQKLYGLVTKTEAVQAAIEAGHTIDPKTEFAKIGDGARQAVKEMRLFLYQMQQVDIEKEGLVSVLHHRLSAVEGRADIRARLMAGDEIIQLPTEKEIMLYYIAQEALNNVLRHAKAKTVTVTIKQGKKTVSMEIADDGVGFDAKKLDRAGLGLQNMRARTEQMNGKLTIDSKPDEGTRISVTVPRDPNFERPKPLAR